MYEERVYHGIGLELDEDEDEVVQPARVFVEPPRDGPTERENVLVLYALETGDSDAFGWGHNGGGTSRTAAAVLADALELGPLPESGIRFGAYPEDDTLVELREAFCSDVLMHCCNEWRLTRGAVLRWSRSWYLQHQITELPAALVTLPPTGAES